MEQRHPSRSKDGLPPHAQYDDVEEGQPLLSNSRSPSPQLARDKLPDHGASYSLPSSSSAAGSATTSYQSFPRPPIPRSPSPTSTSVLERMNNFLKLAKNTEDEEEARERASCGWFYCEWREHLGHWLESRAVQYFFISLLILDIVLLTCELAFEEYFSNEEGEAWVLIAKDVFEYLSVGILLTFALEVVLLIVAFDVSFFTHPFYVIDAIIIGVSLFFDLYLKEALASFLVVFRFWRVIRVVHSIVAAEEERHGETRREKNHLQNELRAYQDTTAELQRTIEAKDSELARLRNKCAELERLLADATVHSIIPAEPSLVAAS